MKLLFIPDCPYISNLKVFLTPIICPFQARDNGISVCPYHESSLKPPWHPTSLSRKMYCSQPSWIMLLSCGNGLYSFPYHPDFLSNKPPPTHVSPAQISQFLSPLFIELLMEHLKRKLTENMS